MFLCSKNTNNIKSEVLPNASLYIFPGCSLIGRSHPVEPFSFTGAIGISDGFVWRKQWLLCQVVLFLCHIAAIWFIYLYILLLCYIAIYLYIYIGIVLFVYCLLVAWGYYFLYIYILFLFLTSTSIFYDSGCRLSIIWLFTVQRYGGSVRYQTPGDALFG